MTTKEKLEAAKASLDALRKQVRTQEWAVEQLTRELAVEAPWGWIATYEEDDAGVLQRQEVYAVSLGLWVRIEGDYTVSPIEETDSVHAHTDYEYEYSSTLKDGECKGLNGDIWLAFRRADAEFPDVWSRTPDGEDDYRE
ncbi:MAG: hypothetical protein WC657_07665 [Candidatus Paceibacterota bacterium]|jgi:hypothetical protein